MSRLHCRCSIAWVAAVLVLFSPGAVDAEEIVVVVPGPKQPKHLPGPWLTGAKYDMMNKAHAEHQLAKLEAKSRSHGACGDSAALQHDAHRIAELKYRIAVDDWLIRKLAQHEPGYYPRRIDEPTLIAIAEAARPSEDPAAVQYNLASDPVPTPAPMAAARTASITIVNAEPAGAGVAFEIDGIPHQAAGGSRQDLAVPSGSFITFDGGGSVGRRRYRVSPGVYEFRSTPEGWALYKLPATP